MWSAKCAKLALQRDQAFDKCAERNAGGKKSIGVADELPVHYRGGKVRKEEGWNLRS